MDAATIKFDSLQAYKYIPTGISALRQARWDMIKARDNEAIKLVLLNKTEGKRMLDSLYSASFAGRVGERRSEAGYYRNKSREELIDFLISIKHSSLDRSRISTAIAQ